jgi:hypothetical protein
VANRRGALREFHRILKPGGRISIAEPILQDDAFHAMAVRKRLESGSLPVDRFFELTYPCEQSLASVVPGANIVASEAGADA